MIKRFVDIVFSLVAMVVLAVWMLLIALAVKLSSPGPAIFRQRRTGWRGKPFTMLKFRTMRSDVDPYGHSPHSSEDLRLTRVGRFLREKQLDELPQLFNVLTGRMSIVGPRPLYERQAELWSERQRRRLEAKPGITGYAQIYGGGALTHEEKIELDLYYVEHRTFWLDLKLIFQTFVKIITGKSQIYEQRYSEQKQYEADRTGENGLDETTADREGQCN